MLLVSETVEPDLVGATCSWDFHSHNQSSVHPGNDLILATGGEQWVLAGVEDTAGGELALTGSFRLGETLTVTLRLGPDGVFSAGISVEVLCDDAAATTTTAPTETTIPATATTVVPVTSTTAPSETGSTTTTTPPTSSSEPPAGDSEVKDNGGTTPPTTPSDTGRLAETGPSESTVPLTLLAVVLLLTGSGIVGLAVRARDPRPGTP